MPLFVTRFLSFTTRRRRTLLKAATAVSVSLVGASTMISTWRFAEATQKHRDQWVGSGQPYYGGEWAYKFFLGALEEECGDKTKIDMVQLTTMLQASIIQRLDAMERKAWVENAYFHSDRKGLETPLKFRVDVDDRRENGKLGITAVIQGGLVVEKAGVGVTMLSKKLNPRMAKQMAHNHPALKEYLATGEVNDLSMWVNGISCIVHPVNPKAPTVHFNYRHFQITKDDGSVVAWWFGGGQDLTPIYLFEEDAHHLHSLLKRACDKHNPEYYPKFKKWADEYFYHTARKEARGIGGIFFDDLDSGSKENIFSFVKDCADTFEPSYFPILQKRSEEKYGETEKKWQALRHGRYVEFNLVYDRGTKFGFSVPGVNIEAVLMSLPLTVGFMYKHLPKHGTEEDKLLKILTGKPRDWATTASVTGTSSG